MGRWFCQNIDTYWLAFWCKKWPAAILAATLIFTVIEFNECGIFLHQKISDNFIYTGHNQNSSSTSTKKRIKLGKKFFKRVSKIKFTRNTIQCCSIKRTKMGNCVMMLLFVKTNKNNSFNRNHFEGGFVYSHVFITMFSTLSAPSKQQLYHRNEATTKKRAQKYNFMTRKEFLLRNNAPFILWSP